MAASRAGRLPVLGLTRKYLQSGSKVRLELLGDLIASSHLLLLTRLLLITVSSSLLAGVLLALG